MLVAMLLRETVGVKVRVEVGPSEVERGDCVVAVARTPGAVADKTTVHVKTKLKVSNRTALCNFHHLTSMTAHHDVGLR